MDETIAQDAQEQIEKPKKKGNFLKKLIIFVAVIAIIVVGLGFALPGLLWTRNLGVSYSQADYDSAVSKLKYIKDSAPTTGEESEYAYSYGAPVDVNTSFTSAEITAFFNINRPSYYAVKNVEVKINQDGSIEASGSVNVDYVLTEILGGKFTRSDIVKKIPALGILPSNVNIYLDFSGSVKDNIASISPSTVTVQGIPIPDNIVKSSDSIKALTDGLNSFIAKNNEKTGSTVNDISAKNGEIVIDGKFPTSLTRTKK